MPAPTDFLRRALAPVLLCIACTAWAGAYDDLMMAANNGNTERVVELLQKGMDVNTTDLDGNSLLMLAVRSGNQPLIDFLLQHRASLGRRNRYGDDVLMQATNDGKLETVKKLMAAGAEVQHPGWTALHYAVIQGHADLVAYLLEKGADVTAKGPNGQTALMMAERRDQSDIVQMLKAKQAEVELAEAQRKAAADQAAAKDGGDSAKAPAP
ncbi:MAG TPA: ankyrin repeat domain-containing protein [Rhodocyclaceae bacterium]|nr:ankyrin repeat domain-containing protein [Rhodocyclaceae bacterium]